MRVPVFYSRRLTVAVALSIWPIEVARILELI